MNESQQNHLDELRTIRIRLGTISSTLWYLTAIVSAWLVCKALLWLYLVSIGSF